MMSGINKEELNLLNIFEQQKLFQQTITTSVNLPEDNVEWFQYHISALVEEVGELLKSDKRWKTHRNTHYDKENKLEELADVYITVLNLVLFSGFSREELKVAVAKKIAENFEKWRNNNGIRQEDAEAKKS